ncbi:MAG: hypothetical protein ACKOWF_00735 [Chloroflexota bacterium]
MDSFSFDPLTRWLGAATTRRTGLGASLAALVGLGAPAVGAEGGSKEVSAEACIPNGRRCGKKGKKGRPCSQCCSRFTAKKRKDRCACRPDGTDCKNSSQCCNGLCRKKVCVNPNSECVKTSDCKNGNTCQAGVCSCGASGFCPTICTGGSCIECQADSDCGGGRLCINGTCGLWVNTSFAPDETSIDQSNNVGEPRAVWLDGSGLMMAVTDNDNQRAVVFTRPSVGVQEWTAQSYIPQGSGPEGNPSGGCGPDNLDYPEGVVLSADGLTIYVSDNNCDRVNVWTRTSSTSTSWTAQSSVEGGASGSDSYMGRPYGIWVSSDATRVYIAGRDDSGCRILVFSRTSATATTWTFQYKIGDTCGTDPGQLNDPSSIYLVQDETVMFIVERDSHRVSVWTRPSTSSTTWTMQSQIAGDDYGYSANKLYEPRFVISTSSGLRVAISDRDNNRVAVWGRDSLTSTVWRNLTLLGSEGTGIGGLDQPRGLYSPDELQTIYVVDTDNNRVSIWEL